jgi:hypothetical protein
MLSGELSHQGAMLDQNREQMKVCEFLANAITISGASVSIDALAA